MLEYILPLIEVRRQVYQPQLPFPIRFGPLFINRNPGVLIHRFKVQPRTLILLDQIVLLVVVSVGEVDDLLPILLLIILLQIERVGRFKHPNLTQKEYIMVLDVIVGGCQWNPTDLVDLFLLNIYADDLAALGQHADDLGGVH